MIDKEAIEKMTAIREYRIKKGISQRPDGNERQCFDSIPTLDSYFAPIWPESVIESAKTVIEPLKTVCPTAGVRPFYYFWFEEMQEG